jgi:hypothetical protein
MQVAVARFIEWDLDVFLSGTHAPHYSAFNRVERRMAPLSRELAGLILPHDHFGTHLNASGKTVDTELEKSNFRKAGETLAEVWSSVVIDNYKVVAQYVEQTDADTPSEPDSRWTARHVRQSQYFLQIVKCDESGCCKPWRSTWKTFFPSRFVPGPVVLSQTAAGLVIPEAECARKLRDGRYTTLSQRLSYGLATVPENAPFDLHCPSLSHADIVKRQCSVCSLYHSSQAAAKRHQHMHDTSERTLEYDIEEDISAGDLLQTGSDAGLSSSAVTLSSAAATDDDQIPVIRNLFDWLRSSFEPC